MERQMQDSDVALAEAERTGNIREQVRLKRRQAGQWRKYERILQETGRDWSACAVTARRLEREADELVSAK